MDPKTANERQRWLRREPEETPREALERSSQLRDALQQLATRSSTNEASRLRKQYTGFQPSIDVEEVEEEEGVKVPSSRVARRYAIDSSSESSESEVEEKPRRR
jgi:hypothetical protein